MPPAYTDTKLEQWHRRPSDGGKVPVEIPEVKPIVRPYRVIRGPKTLCDSCLKNLSTHEEDHDREPEDGE